MSWSMAFALGVLRGMGWALVVGALWWLSWKLGRALERRLAGWLLHRTTRLPRSRRIFTNARGEALPTDVQTLDSARLARALRDREANHG